MKPLDTSVGLWSINRWLRWTGFRLYVNVAKDIFVNENHEPTRLGIRFYGWKR